MGKTVKCGVKYSEADINECLSAIKKGVPFRAACRRFNIPRSTVKFRCSGKWSGKTRKGKPTALTIAEENDIVLWIMRMARKGFPITKDRLVLAVTNYLKNNPRNQNCNMKAGLFLLSADIDRL